MLVERCRWDKQAAAVFRGKGCIAQYICERCRKYVASFDVLPQVPCYSQERAQLFNRRRQGKPCYPCKPGLRRPHALTVH